MILPSSPPSLTDAAVAAIPEFVFSGSASKYLEGVLPDIRHRSLVVILKLLANQRHASLDDPTMLMALTKLEAAVAVMLSPLAATKPAKTAYD